MTDMISDIHGPRFFGPNLRHGYLLKKKWWWLHSSEASLFTAVKGLEIGISERQGILWIPLWWGSSMVRYATVRENI